MKKKVYEFIPAVLAILLSIGVVTVFKACDPMEDGSWMNCHNAQMQVFVLGLVLTALSVVGLFLKESLIKKIIEIVSIVLAVIIAIVPGVITHLCMMDTMRCHTLMRPFVIIFGILFIVAQVVVIVFGIINSKKEQN